jgi:hypothetical protein
MAIEPLPTTLLSDRVPQWWRPFTVDPTSERLARVRGRVERLRESLSAANGVDAVAYAHGDTQAGERIIDAIRDATRQPAVSYEASAGDAEPPALTAAALADQLAVEPDSDLSTALSLLIVSARYSGLEPAIEGMRLGDYAERQLEYRSASSRRLRQLGDRGSAVAFVDDALSSLDPAPQSRNGQDAPYAQLIRSLATRMDEFAAGTDAEHAVVRELLRQQAWTHQSWCETAQADWSDVPPLARPIIAAIELAEQTNGPTPAIGAEALLASVLGDSVERGHGVDPVEAVASAGPHVGDHLTSAPHARLFPIATELSRWRASASEQTPEWRQPVGPSAEEWPDAIEIGMQTYRELLALRVFGNE